MPPALAPGARARSKTTLVLFMNQMNRRSILSWLGVMAAGTVASLRARADAPPRKDARILSFESFRVAHPDHVQSLHTYLESGVLPALRQVHAGPRMVFEALVAPHAPEVLLLSSFSSFEEVLEVNSKMAANVGTRRTRAGLESASAAVLEDVQSQLMTVLGDTFCAPAGSQHLRAGVFELRSYHAAAWQNAPPAAVSAIFARAGVQPIVNAATAAGEHMPKFTYLIPFESLAARQEAWARVDADPAWAELQRDSIAKCGARVKVTAKSIYKLAPYSPVA
ncbi:MAG: hypothetical protein C5B50_21685 [Verrucomicrobia bacterium]|nr:MAG: hypothetical protein C5B50_21685 [Verrucomicrobiota bacterium]